ncbi:putative nuclease of restriction endonuclease-like (RecB) superfamily [Chryseobacterium ginsenosidimutans]|uniref:PDDEXK nuclease domain-containing protein n=1 Tax=Chryseobacterium ginsenosidimutans TaxID=687846 RepID=UPI0027897A37|nr:PDDEXK nuclease domain-containing protein [Chryseobacterium ginsenosidimutans]MDQ0594932.1 putative nuclease of restriction endonuclease-like (RecB) superfamily [Chryseobacterium ginsenosidimutans]
MHPLSSNLYSSVKHLIENAKSKIVRNINMTMIMTYFQIGEMIVEDEQSGRDRAEYSKETLKNLSKQLIEEFGRGYSVDNLQWMRKFYLMFQKRISQEMNGTSGKYETLSRISVEDPNYETLSRNSVFTLSWSHYIQLMKIDDENERNFYEIEATENNWSVRELTRQFNSALYERLALSKDKDDIKQLAQKGQIVEKPTDLLKSHYVLEFLDLKQDHRYSESDLETEIINKLEHFMLELGKGFLFEGRQRRFTFEGDSFFVDLVFYNRLLKCFVLFDLKIGKLTHQDIGQMQMYVNYYDRKVKLTEENPTIGIILCKEENKTVIEFTLPENNNTIFAKEYKAILPSKEELKKQIG